MSKLNENLVDFYYNKLNEAPSRFGMVGKALGGVATAVGLGELIDALQAGMSPEDVKYNQAASGTRSGSGGGFNVNADAASALASGDRAKYNQYVASLYNSGMSQNQITGSAIRTRAIAANTAKEQAANIRATALKDDVDVKAARKALENARAARDVPGGGSPDPTKVAAAQEAAKKLKEAERAALEKTSYYDVARRRNALQSGGFNAPTQEKPQAREPFRYVNPNSAEARLMDSGVLTQNGKINPEYGEKDEFGFLNTPAGRAAALRAAKEDTRKMEKEMRNMAPLTNEPVPNYDRTELSKKIRKEVEIDPTNSALMNRLRSPIEPPDYSSLPSATSRLRDATNPLNMAPGVISSKPSVASRLRNIGNQLKLPRETDSALMNRLRSRLVPRDKSALETSRTTRIPNVNLPPRLIPPTRY